jgi:hypothetical protein
MCISLYLFMCALTLHLHRVKFNLMGWEWNTFDVCATFAVCLLGPLGLFATILAMGARYKA